jgi:hypothetical protein
MSNAELEAWMRQKLEGFELKKLVLDLKKLETAPYQVPRRSRFQTPEKLKVAVIAALRQKLKDRSMKLVPYGPDQWIIMMFAKGKGRIDPETGEEAVRFLTDLRQVNAALKWPEHWNDQMATLQALREDVPSWAAWFSAEDISNAFEGIDLSDELREMLTVVPPVPLGPRVFTPEELRDWGHTDAEIEELMAVDEWFGQWAGLP